MKRKMMKFLSLFLSVSMAINMFTVPVFAAPEDESAATEQSAVIEDDAVENVENGTEQEDVSNGTESDADAAPAEETPAEETPEAAEPEEAPKRETISVEESYKAFTVNVNDIEISVDGEGVIVLGAGEEPAEVDTSSPTISVVEEELNNIRVLNDEGESVALTEEQIQTVLYLYQQYLDQWKDNANLLGVQTPFFLQYNDDGEDGLGTLGEMLVLAGYTVDDVRSGEYSYDDLVGMIQNFYYADKFGIQYYGDQIAEARAEVLKKVEDSGATTLVQKMLVINDWLAHKATFDMSYIMNMGEDEPIMVAQNPQEHKYYDEIYAAMYDVYEKQITQQFHDQIYDSIVAQFRQQYYEGAIKNIVMEGYKSQVRQSVIDQAVENGSTEEEAEADADAYMEENEEQIEADASDYAAQYMEDNADAISEDAAGFVEENFGPDVAAQVSAGADEFIADAEENGVEVDPENAPGYKMTIEEITQNTMENEAILDLDGDGENETTANQAIPIFADQAATGLTNGILGAWEGNHIGILNEDSTGVCCGYAKAFAYLVQYMMPEKYGINGADTDMSVASNWKTADQLYYDADGNLDIDQDYVVDLVRITFKTSVTMYGEENPDFNSDHFWNAVKVDGKWYYIDPCYIDVYTEVMSRDRVEIDGNLNHMYFMFSHDTAAEMYDGYMGGDGIKTLYADAATDTSYEDSWYARIASNTYSDGKYFYYLYDSTDMFGIMRKMNSDQDSSQNSSTTDYEEFEAMSNAEYKIVRHEASSQDVGNDGDSDYDALIEFNYEVDDDNTVARVYNPVNDQMEENDFLTELFAQFKEECEIYPSIAISTALYDGKLYFNLSNCILSYDLETGAVVKVKEYNTVYGARDNTIAFGGMAFSVVDSASEATHTVENHPIASMTIKDGNMYVSIATNFAYISGKDPHNCTDGGDNGYGYEFEESNYNSEYSTYFDMSQLAGQGSNVNSDKNDNDEFMWSAVFVDTLIMSHLAGGSHSYAQVTVEPFCGRDGFTEERCTECGAIKADSRTVDEGSACDHHYIHFAEEYYTREDEKDPWNTGDCYVCTICGYAVSEPTEPTKNNEESQEDFEERKKQYEEDTAEYDAAVQSAGHVYTTDSVDVEWSEDEAGSPVATIKAGTTVTCDPCEGKALDVLQEEENKNTSVELKEDVTLTEIDKKAVGKCEDGLTVTYIATGSTEDGTKLSATKTETTKPGEHAYVAEFTWTPVKEAEPEEPETPEEESEAEVAELAEEGSEDSGETEEPDTEDEIPYTVTAVFTCASCGDKIEDGIEVEVTKENSVAASCTEPGKTVYSATATVKDENGDTIATGTDTKEDEIAVLPHDYVGEFTWTEVTDSEGKGTGEYTATATVTCVNGCGFDENVEAEVEEDAENEKNKAATCTEDGVKVLKATATVTVGEGEEVEEVTVEDEKEVVIPALGHSYEASFDWADDYSAATVTLTCTEGDDTVTDIEATVELDEDASVAATCTKAGKNVYTATVEYEGVTYTDNKEETVDALRHALDAKWTWVDVNENEEGKVVYDKEATDVTVTCSHECGTTFTIENLQTEKVSTENATCTEDGKNVFKATATVKDESGNEVQTIEDTQERTIPALEHSYTKEFTWTETTDADGNKSYTATADIKCVRDDVEYNDVEAVVVKDEDASAAATCTEDGKDVFIATATVYDEDNNVIVEVSDEKEDVIPALGHDYGEPVWDWADDYSAATATITCSRDESHVVSAEAAITSQTEDADCETPGTITYTATAELEGKTYTDTQTVTGQALGHEYKAVFTWADATDEDAEVPYTVTVKLVCDRCEKEITDVPVTVVLNEEKSAAATCEEDGKNVYTATATYEGKEYTEDKEDVIKASGHKYVDEWDWVENATYDTAEDRYTVMVCLTCEICNTVVNPTPTVTMTSEEATCEEDGKNVYTATATYEGKEYTSTKTDTVKALGHAYGEPTWEWAKDNSTASAKFTCSRDEHVERVEATVTSETTEPTCEEDGKIVYTATCEFEGETYTDTQEEKIPALGHDYGEEPTPQWAWAEDYSTATATFTCANGHTTEVTATVTSESKDADCETAGTVTYTATVELEGKTYTDVKTVEGQALGHDYGEPEWNWAEDNSSAEAVFTCSRDASHKETVTATVTSETADATCEKDGEIIYTATCEFNGQEYRDRKTEVIPALGHDYGEPSWVWAEDYSSAKAIFTCANDGTHVENVEAVITKKIDREAEKTIYTATATLDGKEYTDVQEVEGISEEDINPFVDVSEDDYYYDAVLWAFNNNITTGYDETHFAPLEDCTRAQVVTFLWRAVGEPEPKAVKQPFVDVAEGDYYYKAVLWAYENGITTGKDETHFAPNEKVSREQFVTFLYRQKGEPAYTTENPFVDVEEGTFYYDAILWAYENGITTGTDETHFSPEAICIRGDVVTFLYRAYGEEE